MLRCVSLIWDQKKARITHYKTKMCYTASVIKRVIYFVGDNPIDYPLFFYIFPCIIRLPAGVFTYQKKENIWEW